MQDASQHLANHSGISGSMEIQLPNGDVSLIDADDWVLVQRFKWRISHPDRKSRYAVAWRPKWYPGTSKRIVLHRLVLGDPVGVMIDHINGNGLDNRKCNLRIATASQNAMNRPGSGASGFKGVHRHGGRWRAEVRVDGVRHRVHVATAEEAAREYDRLALIHHGEFALLNFPAPDQPRVGIERSLLRAHPEPIRCAIKVQGLEPVPFTAQFFAIQDASPLQPAKVKPRVAPGGADEDGAANRLISANDFNRISHEDAFA